MQLTGKSSSSLPNSPRGGSPSSSLDHGQGHPLSKTQQIQPTSVSKPGESGSGLQTSGGGSSTQPKSPLATSTPAKSAGKSQVQYMFSVTSLVGTVVHWVASMNLVLFDY